jgi:hypothetical protein
VEPKQGLQIKVIAVNNVEEGTYNESNQQDLSVEELTDQRLCERDRNPPLITPRKHMFCDLKDKKAELRLFSNEDDLSQHLPCNIQTELGNNSPSDLKQIQGRINERFHQDFELFQMKKQL